MPTGDLKSCWQMDGNKEKVIKQWMATAGSTCGLDDGLGLDSSIRETDDQSQDSRVHKAGHDLNQGVLPFLVLQEKIDVNAGLHVLSSIPMMTMSKTDTAQWRSYSNLIGLAMTLGGHVPVKYYLDSTQRGIGRFKSCINVTGYGNLPSYTRMQREIRAHLACSNYWDVDIVNCQPTIMLQVLKQHGIPCRLLQHYVGHREDCLEEVMDTCRVPRDAAKNLLIRLLYFGRVDTWLTDMARASGMDEPVPEVPAWIRGFQAELTAAGARLIDLDELAEVRDHCKHRTTSNYMGSVISLYLQTQERLCLEALADAVQRDGRQLGGLIHDGLHILKEPGEDRIPDDMLRKWERAMQRKTGYSVALSVKAFECNPAWIATCVHADKVHELQETMSYEDMKKAWERQNDSQGTLVSRRHPFLKRWLKDGTMRQYDKMDVYPPPLKAPADQLNLWTPFDVERERDSASLSPNEPQEPSAGCRTLINHVHILLGLKP